MDTIIYGIFGIVLLIGSGFLFTYFDDVQDLLSLGRIRIIGLGKRNLPRISIYMKMALRISDRNGYYPSPRK